MSVRQISTPTPSELAQSARNLIRDNTAEESNLPTRPFEANQVCSVLVTVLVLHIISLGSVYIQTRREVKWESSTSTKKDGLDKKKNN
jgi:hypothetical protein